MKLSKELFYRAKKLDIVSFTLHWEGGSDEGYLYVDLEILPKRLNGISRWELRQKNPEYHQQLRSIETDIDRWAHEAFAYNGAGDGTRYGDTYEYNLVEGTITHRPWSMVRHEGEVSRDSLETQ